MRRHELKTWPEPFAALLAGEKTYEVRRFDRPFDVGDELYLREWVPGERTLLSSPGMVFGYTGRELRATIVHLTRPGSWGLPADVGVLGVKVTQEVRNGRPERLFPVMTSINGGPGFPECPRYVPWSMLEPHEERVRRNHDQTLERLAQRGGLDPVEIWAIVHDRSLFRDEPKLSEAIVWLNAELRKP